MCSFSVLRKPSVAHIIDRMGEFLAGGPSEEGRLTRVWKRAGVGRIDLDAAGAGDIVSVTGLAAARVADTIGAPNLATALAPGVIEPPTLRCTHEHRGAGSVLAKAEICWHAVDVHCMANPVSLLSWAALGVELFGGLSNPWQHLCDSNGVRISDWSLYTCAIVVAAVTTV